MLTFKWSIVCVNQHVTSPQVMGRIVLVTLWTPVWKEIINVLCSPYHLLALPGITYFKRDKDAREVIAIDFLKLHGVIITEHAAQTLLR